ncbi:MAG: glycosyltransferase [Bacteroidetes bacterium]|nr:glycosyltransferase [Bacteroidota bacterium]HET6244692.1 glycosyltransferase [Bacteroidia bacterium]
MQEKQANIAVVVVAYNREVALERILNSLAIANYDGFANIPLIISIDKSETDAIEKIAKSFNWLFGKKKIIVHNENLGLKNHIISCGDLTSTYENVIVLEDDLYVSPYFYDYAYQAREFYKNDENVAGISLYSIDCNDHAVLPFIPIADGFDNFFMQVPSSLGQMWTKKQWHEFKKFYDSDNVTITHEDIIPDKVIAWGESSWKKYFYKYLVNFNKFFVYPRVSFTTNFGDPGTHFILETKRFQVNICMNTRTYNFSRLSEALAQYDCFHELMPEIIKKMNPQLGEYDFTCDLYGEKNLGKINNEFIISIRDCNSPLKSFSCGMIPQELNIALAIDGDYFSLGKTIHFNKQFDQIHPKRLKLTTFSKISTFIIRHKAYNDAEKNFKNSISYKVSRLILFPLLILKKLKIVLMSK